MPKAAALLTPRTAGDRPPRAALEKVETGARPAGSRAARLCRGKVQARRGRPAAAGGADRRTTSPGIFEVLGTSSGREESRAGSSDQAKDQLRPATRKSTMRWRQLAAHTAIIYPSAAVPSGTYGLPRNSHRGLRVRPVSPSHRGPLMDAKPSNKTATLTVGDKNFDLPILEGQRRARRHRHPQALRRDRRLHLRSRLHLDRQLREQDHLHRRRRGRAVYRGYPIEQLAENADFLEVCYLLLNGELPTAAQKKEFDTTSPITRCCTSSSPASSRASAATPTRWR